MPFRYREEESSAGRRILEAWGQSVEEMVCAAVDAATSLMVEDPDSIAGDEIHTITIESTAEDRMLAEVLTEIIFYKEAHRLLLKLDGATVTRSGGSLLFQGSAHGERFVIHRLTHNITGVTLHRLGVERTGRRWKATVVFEIEPVKVPREITGSGEAHLTSGAAHGV